eukprot:5841543-Prymnesium_polylepis.1
MLSQFCLMREYGRITYHGITVAMLRGARTRRRCGEGRVAKRRCGEERVAKAVWRGARGEG